MPKLKLYLASGFHWRNQLRELTKGLEAKGHMVVSNWIWLENRPERGTEQYDEFASKIANQNLIDLIMADAIIVDMNGVSATSHGGVHFEQGFMVARNKPVYVIGERTMTFQWLPDFIQVVDNKELLEKYL